MSEEIHSHVRDILVLTSEKNEVFIFVEHIQSITRTNNKRHTYLTFCNGESIIVDETPEQILNYLKVRVMKKEENKGVQ